MGMPGPWEILIILAQALGLGGAGVPLGAPPQAPRPELYSIAPDDCLLYMTSYGAAEADPNSPNETEQLIAEPEVQAFLAELERTIMQLFPSNSFQRDMDTAYLAYEFVKGGLANPWAVAIDDIKIKEGGKPEIQARLLVHVGEDVARWDSWLETIAGYRSVVGHQGIGYYTTEAVTDQITAYVFYDLEDNERVRWAFVDGYLILGIGPGVFEDALARFQSKAPAPDWLTEGLASFDILRPSTFLYVNTEQLFLKGEAEIPGDVLDMYRGIQEKVGITNVQSIVAVSGFDEVAFVEEVHMQFDGPPQGLLGGLTSGGLTDDALSIVPSDANLAAAYSVDLEEVLAAILQLTELAPQTHGPAPQDIVENFSYSLEMMFGVNPVEDLLPLLGDSIVLYNSPDEGGTFFTGLTLAVDVKDVDKFQALQETFIAHLQSMEEHYGRLIQIQEYGDDTLYSLLIQEVEHPLLPTWCVHDDRLLISLIPQNLRAVLSRGDDFESLADVLQEEGSEPCLYMRADGKDLIETFYPFLLYGAHALKSQGIVSNDLAISIPSLSTITRYVQPTECVIFPEDNLLVIRTTKTFPASTLTTIPILFGFLAPVANIPIPATDRVQSMNNMKMIGLALHNYHASNGSLPPAYTVDEDGKPLLSWRVLILPELEYGNLYRMFHLDEPWDSPHNLPLSEQVIEIYRSPQSNALPNMTTYLSIRDPQSMFPGSEGIHFARVTDGLSNTIMVLEAADSEAVVWSKPDDYVPQLNEPGWEESLISPWINGTNILLGDGSVHLIEPDILSEMFELLLDRDDGNVVRLD
jgi:hypothetical protein